ncbi:hypothetical protein KP509_06G029400 [Ceratopteris richardii]|uniref:Uncharacterized protein n=1 Tax=Ceratopteris richardii TaxID=49495 RepID=A0A8T2UMC1_CERRI|nr:hypothetical protein KP509_06G029400 [Ceratopteris richardii]
MSGLAEEIAQGCLSSSPQSTLTGMANWDFLNAGARSNGRISSGVSSPPTPVESNQLAVDDESLDLLYSELLRLKMEDEINLRQQQLLLLKQKHYEQLLWQMRQKQTPSSRGIDKLDSLYEGDGYGHYPSLQSGTDQSFRNLGNGFHRSNQRMDFSSNNQVHCLGRGPQQSVPVSSISSKHGRRWDSSPDQSLYRGSSQFGLVGSYGLGGQHRAKPHPINGSGMRAVFLGMPGARESGGTGVFLPRRIGSSPDSKRRPACSTVLLPSRIVEALKLNVEDTLPYPMSSPSPAGRTESTRQSHPQLRNPPINTNGAASAAFPCSSLQEVAPNVCLPTEWTY